MEQTGSHLMAFIAVVSILCVLIAAIMLINLIQRAFAREGVLWGLIAVIYPPGTYVYCRKHWDVYGRTFTFISALLIVGLLLWLLIKYI